ncbi:helix-turn-helix transcriptional regulator [Mycobacterium sp. P7213]|uniref:helix-turn-helix transcriptional regulator n=1 Tax=Mycobacterium sp. P7213 TaxID=2478465 RepID=UPI000F6423C3|nr:AAA family ATPase [Mycobacterium sp. P7213]
MRLGLADRKAEMSAVCAFLEAALTEPATLLLEGEAGIGKSTLLWGAAAAAVERGFQVLSAAGAPTEVRYAYAAVADLLGGVEAEVLAQLPDGQRAAVDRILLGGDDGPASDERMVATAFLAVLRKLSSKTPVLLCIDDVQWLDMSSQMVIGFAERRLTGRVGLLLALRTGETDVADLSWLSPALPGSIERVRITPLTLGGVHALISARLRRTLPRPTVTRIHQTSGGNPFFALELARFIVEDPDRAAIGLPDSLATLVHEHIGQVDAEVGAVLLAAACSVPPTVERVSLATGISPERVVEVAESAPASGVVGIDGSRIRFRHPLFATGVYSAAGPSERRAMHRRLSNIVTEPEVKARHLALAATTADPEVLQALDGAAAATRARGAPAVAAELIELAIKLGDDNPVRRIQAAEQHFRSGEVALARSHLQCILDDLPSGNPLRCMALMLLAAVTGYVESLVTAAELLTKAVAEAADHPVLQLRARLLLVPVAGLIGDMKRSVELANTAVEQAEDLDIAPLRSQALTIAAHVRLLYGLGVDRKALRWAAEIEDHSSGAAATFRASAALPVMAAVAGEVQVGRDQMRAIHQRFLAHGTEVDTLWAANYVARFDLWLGNLTAAADLAEDSVQRAEQMGGTHLLVHAWCTQAEIAALRGDEDAARSIATTAIEAASDTGAAFLVASATAALGFLEVSRGDYAAAVATLEPLLCGFDPDHDTEIVVGAYLPDAVEALTALGRLDEAEPLIVALETNGARLDRPWMLAVGARGRSHWLAARGELEAAERTAIEALLHHGRLPMPFETARTQLLLGQVQRRRRRKQDAQASLTTALATFERVGAPLWARRARAELDRMAAAGLGSGLTTAERRVAEHAAAGLSNKQIAAELFIAPKTVEMTLSAVYRKLGIRSRAGLFAALNSGGVQGKP